MGRAFLFTLFILGNILAALSVAWLASFFIALLSIQPAHLDIRFLALVIILSFFSSYRASLFFAIVFLVFAYLTDIQFLSSLALYGVVGLVLYALIHRFFVERTVWSFLFLVVFGSFLFSLGFALMATPPTVTIFVINTSIMIAVHVAIALLIYAALMSLSRSWNSTFLQSNRKQR